MAARLNPKHSEQVLERIKLARLVTLLQDDAFGELKNPKGKAYSLHDGQRRSAMFLIERRIARAQAPLDVAVSGNITVVRRDPTQRPADYQRKGKASV